MTENQKLREALQVAEAALSDIGDADREPGDDLAWCERRAAQSLPLIRQALALPITAPSPTAGMTLWERIQHVGGRQNAATYIEFGSVLAVQSLINHVLRDLPMSAQEAGLNDSKAHQLPCGESSTNPAMTDCKTDCIGMGWSICRTCNHAIDALRAKGSK